MYLSPALYRTCCCQAVDRISSSKRLCQFWHMFLWEFHGNSPCIVFTPCWHWRWDPTSQHALRQLLNANIKQIQTEEKTTQEKQGINTLYMHIQLYTSDEGHHDWTCLSKTMQSVHASDFWSCRKQHILLSSSAGSSSSSSSTTALWDKPEVECKHVELPWHHVFHLQKRSR